jgi:DNA-binding response OmpR family regulator
MDKRILIVEDEIDLREAMADALSEAGFTILTAADGAAGLSLAKTEHPDLILLDLMMPVMNGELMLKKLREDEWGQNAHVIILSAMDDVGHIAHAHEGKLVDYFIKAHMSLDELVKQVRMAIHMV